MYDIFFHFLFRFLLSRDFGWVTEFFQLPTQNLNSIENENENEEKNSYILYEIF